MLAEHRARGVERLAVNLESAPRLARQPGARLEQVPHDVRRNDHHWIAVSVSATKAAISFD